MGEVAEAVQGWLDQVLHPDKVHPRRSRAG